MTSTSMQNPFFMEMCGRSVDMVIAIITSLAKEVVFLVALVCLSVCLFVCGQHYSKSYERIEILWRGHG